MTHMLAAGSPLDHVFQWTYARMHVNAPNTVLTPDSTITLLSNHIAMQVLAVLVLLVFFPLFARSRKTGDPVKDMTPRGMRNAIETLCAMIRDNMVRPALGEHTDRFVPYIWSVFFYIFIINLLGLLPLEPLTRGLVRSFFPDAHHGIGGAATGNIWTTGTLAICTLFMIVFNGLRINGMAFIKHFFQGPIFIAPLIAVLEVIGLFAKCFALTVRLFANMIAGHILLAVLLSFVGMSYAAMGAGFAFGIGVVVVLVGTAFNLLELFVAFLQAFIFAFLTTMFIGQAVVIHHEHHDDHEQGHEHEHGHGHEGHAHAAAH